MTMLKEFGCSYVLCGHSERRQHHEESDESVLKQVVAAADAGLIPVLCIGETADQREMNETNEVLARQLKGLRESPEMLIAYEPVWAIGSGKTPSPEEANAAHTFIRSLLKNKMIRILYGGSVTAKNAAGFFAQPEIDGALVGGASLKLDEFRGIVESAKN